MRRLDTRIVSARIAEAAIRKALGLPYSLDSIPPSLRDAAELAIERVAGELVFSDEKGILRCSLCGKGPFTRKGLYLHIKRVHFEAVEEQVEKIFRELLWSGRVKEETVGATNN